jgi:hypothetical protein
MIRSMQSLQSTKVPIDGIMDKANVVCIYNGILFEYKKEWNPIIWGNKDGILLIEMGTKKTNITFSHSCGKAAADFM